MASHNSKGAIYTAFVANVGIAISKFVAFIMTGATSMLAESVHSLVDSSNQILLLLGDKQARRKPTRMHPFGFGRAHYLYAFIVSIVLFSLGGLFSAYEGIHKIMDPEAISDPLIAYVVLVIAMLLEGFALRTALKEAQSFKRAEQSWWQFLRQTKSVNHVVLTLEDSAALIGLTLAALGITLSILTGNPIWDGVSTILIGALLGVVAAILFREVKSLIIGEAVDIKSERKMRSLILSVDGVDKIVDLKTLYVSPSELFIAMKIIVGRDDDTEDISQTIDEVEARIRRDMPIAKLIYIEPDYYKSVKEQARTDKVIEQNISESYKQ